MNWLRRHIEEHEWSGDFKHGWLTADDRLWNNLDSAQIETLRGWLNE